MKVILLRHAESTANSRGIIDSNLPGAELSYAGIQSVVRRQDYIKKLIDDDITECRCSPFRRALDTFTLLDLDVPLHIDARLGELDYGTYNGVSIEMVEKNITDIFRDASAGVNLLERFGGIGENYAELQARVTSCLIDILESKKGALIVSHETILIEIRKAWDGFYNFQKGNEAPIDHADPICLEFPDREIGRVITKLHGQANEK